MDSRSEGRSSCASEKLKLRLWIVAIGGVSIALSLDARAIAQSAPPPRGI